MTDEPLMYDAAVEGLFVRALGGKVTPRMKARLKEAGLDLDRPLRNAYPLPVFRRCVEIAREEAFAGVSRADADRRMGELIIEGYAATTFGRAMIGMMKLLGTRRSLRRVDDNFKAVSNFTRTRFTEVGPGELEYWINVCSVSPEFSMGVVAASMRASGAKNVRLEPLPRTDDGYRYKILWDE